MYSENPPSTANENPSDSEPPIPMLQRRTVHPDSLKFMDMAKDILDKPEIRQAIEGEQQKPKNGNYS
jgi:hypothetical protein